MTGKGKVAAPPVFSVLAAGFRGVSPGHWWAYRRGLASGGFAQYRPVRMEELTPRATTTADDAGCTPSVGKAPGRRHAWITGFPGACGDAPHQIRRLVTWGSTVRDAAGWSSSAARRVHNPEIVGSNPTPATSVESRPGSSGRDSIFCACLRRTAHRHRPDSDERTTPRPALQAKTQVAELPRALCDHRRTRLLRRVWSVGQGPSSVPFTGRRTRVP